MKNYKRILALGLAGTMILGSNMVVLADEGSTTGSVDYVEPISTDIFSVTLPATEETAATSSSAFILDPQGLIKKTKNSDGTYTGYADSTFDDLGLYFKTKTKGSKYDSDGAVDSEGTEAEANTYSKDSVVYKATNKSSFDVKVKVSAELTSMDGIAPVGETAVTTATAPSMYMALENITGDSNVSPAVAANTKYAFTKGADDKITASFESTIAGKSDNYEYTATAATGGGATYGYAIKDDDSLTWNSDCFRVTGAINGYTTDSDNNTVTNGWDKLTTVAPQLKITWSIVNEKSTPSVTLTAGQTASVSFATSKLAVSKIVRADGTTEVPAARYSVSADNGTLTITFDTTFVTNNISNISTAGETWTITYGDNTTTATFIIKGTKTE